MLCGSFQPPKPVRDTGKSSLTPSWIINWSCSIFFSHPPPFLKRAPFPSAFLPCSLKGREGWWHFTEGGALSSSRQLRRPPATSLYLSGRPLALKSLPDSAACVRTTEELSRQNPSSKSSAECVCVCFKLLSPGKPSYLCHIISCPIRALQKGPVSARLTTWGRDGRMEGATSHPTGISFAPSGLHRASETGKGGRQVRLSMCVF